LVAAVQLVYGVAVRELYVQGLGFRMQGPGFRVQGATFREQGSGCNFQGTGFRVQLSGNRVQGATFREQGSRRQRLPLDGSKLKTANVYHACS